MTITLYSLKNCDTCKKAVKALEGAGKTVSFVDIHAEADLPAKLPGWIEAVGAEALTNTRSTTWRGLDEAQRARWIRCVGATRREPDADQASGD